MQAVAYDTETTGLSAWAGAKMFAFSTCNAGGTTNVYRLDGKGGYDREAARTRLELLWRDGTVAKVMHNSKFDLRFTERLLGRRLAETHVFHDTIIQSHLMQNDHPTHRLKDLGWELAGIPVDDERAIKPYTVGEFENYSTVPPHLMTEYQRRDAERTMLLHMLWWPLIQEDERLLEIYRTELDLVRTTLRMEERGLLLDRERCQQMVRELEQRMDRVLAEGERLLGYHLNFGNDNKVRTLLYKGLKMVPTRWTEKGMPSVDKDALADLGERYSRHPVLALVLQYRSWRNGASILSGYLDLADEAGVIHPDLRTVGTRTGRESCARPNLQNVQKDEALKNPYPVPARRVFRPKPGCVNFHLDYSGIEFRIAVNLTGDEALMRLAAIEDLHAIGAAIMYGDRWVRATPEQRRVLRSAAKNGNFAKMYGASRAKVERTIKHPLSVATYREYDAVFGALDASSRRIVREARERGHAETLWGRRLHLPAGEEYVATNYCIQGTAAEVLKRAQVRVHRYLQEATGGEAGLLLPIHDELVIEWPRKRLREAQEHLREIRRLMTDFPQFQVPMDVEVEVSTVDWSKKEEYPI